MAVNISDRQHVKRLLSTFNSGNVQSMILAATISGANTYATFKARVQANIDAATTSADIRQFGNVFLIPSLVEANGLGILTDTNLNGKTTVAQVQGLYTAEDSSLSLGYTGANLA